jgi:hypothetical protein
LDVDTHALAEGALVLGADHQLVQLLHQLARVGVLDLLREGVRLKATMGEDLQKRFLGVDIQLVVGEQLLSHYQEV